MTVATDMHHSDQLSGFGWPQSILQVKQLHVEVLGVIARPVTASKQHQGWLVFVK